ncbi:GNAT family N-acetyltransferase [Actinoplanes awajinensis]|uniref:Acetyltransferase n=1 Tax=Actinoplanes awajinensis subsp. mycoplanecinus TaxID=135947 RepID=A0A124G9G2_9ACTN|nr:GNAT family N-acetyltransferase [Actinoplanes awajinensis]KUL28840.1 acetyltransferase [Actinoplanes awajinensis subsp. mycoplanecinus]
MTEIVLAGPADRTNALATLVPAFAADPVLRWLFPADDTYPEHATAFFGHLFDTRVRRHAVWLAEGGAAVAMWDPPGADPDPLELELPAEVRERVSAYDHAVHGIMPAGPHWYLGTLATHPERTGRRLGHTVMAAGLRRAAEDGLPAVLETSTEGNVRMYERAGWTLIASITDPLPVWVLAHGL